jgi:hypothetical protein
MSIGNTSLHQRGEIPEIVKLPNGRIRVTRRFHKFTREDIDNANLGSLMGDFGDLDTAGEQISNQGYTNCRLISVEVDTRFNSGSNTDSAVLVKTYETLTDSFVQITDDIVTFTENGLKQITRVYRAVSGTISSNVVGTTALNTGETLASSRIEDNDAFAELTETYVEAGVLSVSTNEDSITDEVVVDALNMDAAAVRSAVAAVTANHNLKSQSTNDFEGLQSFRYVFEVRSTTLETELGDTQIGVSFDTGIQTNGSSDFIIQRQYSISSANVASSIKKLIPPEINDPVFDGTGGTQKAYIVDQEVKPNGKDGAVLTRTFAMLPSHLEEWDEMVIRFPGVERGPFQLDEFFSFRSEPYSEAVPVRICRDFYLSNPQRICRPSEFRPVDKNGNRVSVLTEDTVPTSDEYIGYVNSGKYLNDRVSIHRWQGDIWERRIVQFKAE